jgi:hypothetical protein
MTVYLDWKSAADDWTCPKPPVRCTFCGDRIQPPFAHWHCWDSDKDVCVCTKCCGWVRRGFAADVVRLDKIREAMNPGAPSLQLVQ